MDVKYLNLILIICLSSIFVNTELYGKNNFEEKDTLNVIAYSGLNIREFPSVNSKIVFKLEYGDKVIVKQTHQTLKDTIEFRIGNWILIKKNEIEGFVFDGFLTKMNVPLKLQVEKNDFVSFLYKEFQSEENCTITYEPPEISEKRGGPISVTRLSKDVVFLEITQYECRTSKFVFTQIRQAELISLIDLFYSNSNISKLSLNKALKENLESNETFNSKWTIYFEGYGIGFDFINGYNTKSIAFFECN